MLTIFGCDPPATEQQSGDSSTKPVRPVTVIASGDTHGWIMPCGCTSNQSGGLLRRGSYVDERRESGEVILVDVGGAADGTAPYQLERFRAILKGEHSMELAAHNLGAAEIAFGAEVLQQLSQETGITFISANARDHAGQLLTTPFVLAEQGGQKILITGVLSPSFADRNTQVSDPADAILAVVNDVGADQNRLVVLAYLPVDELRQLAETLPEAHVIIGGPTGQSLAPEQIGPVLLTSATNKGKFLAEVTFPAKASDPPAAKVVEMSPQWSDHPVQRQNLTAFRQILAERDFSADESGLVAARFGTDGDRHSDANSHGGRNSNGHASLNGDLNREGEAPAEPMNREGEAPAKPPGPRDFPRRSGSGEASRSLVGRSAEAPPFPEGIASGRSQRISGTESCRDCHAESCDVWDATGHAHAWQRLQDEDGAHVDPFCQKCHTTGYGLPGGFHSMKHSVDRVNVGCESCHGPSKDHVADSNRRTPLDAVGSCVQCHDEENSPEFEFGEYWKRIRHE
ncbi:MAG: multiheme c-type cytochrome [Planctomycetaceae bacterium]